MADIYLIRHGQASFGKANYDELSAQGQAQSYRLGVSMAEQLGKSLQRRQVKVVHGTLLRHRQTLDEWLVGFNPTQLGMTLSVAEDSAFNEFDHEDMLEVAFPEYTDKGALAAHLMQTENPRKAFHQLYERAVARWISGQHDDDYRESFAAFKLRCANGFRQLVANARSGESIFVFTSGGPIGMSVQWALGLDDATTFKINSALVNSSVTHFLTNTQGDCTLGYLNNYGHLFNEGVEVTYR